MRIEYFIIVCRIACGAVINCASLTLWLFENHPEKEYQNERDDQAAFLFGERFLVLIVSKDAYGQVKAENITHTKMAASINR